MASILEFKMAELAAESVDHTGNCQHACIQFSPLGLAKPEADDLSRFDPEAFDKLSATGITVHEVEFEDFDSIGQLSHLALINQFDNRTDRKLYKHAIANRLGRDLLIASASPEKDLVEAICMAFGNKYHIL